MSFSQSEKERSEFLVLSNPNVIDISFRIPCCLHQESTPTPARPNASLILNDPVLKAHFDQQTLCKIIFALLASGFHEFLTPSFAWRYNDEFYERFERTLTLSVAVMKVCH